MPMCLPILAASKSKIEHADEDTIRDDRKTERKGGDRKILESTRKLLKDSEDTTTFCSRWFFELILLDILTDITATFFALVPYIS